MNILKKYFTKVVNPRNNQINLSVKKKVLENDGIDLDDILEMKLQNRIKSMVYKD